MSSEANSNGIVWKREQNTCVSNNAEKHPCRNEEKLGPFEEGKIKRALGRLNVLVSILDQDDANNVDCGGADGCDAKCPGNANVGNHGFRGQAVDETSNTASRSRNSVCNALSPGKPLGDNANGTDIQE